MANNAESDGASESSAEETSKIKLDSNIFDISIQLSKRSILCPRREPIFEAQTITKGLTAEIYYKP